MIALCIDKDGHVRDWSSAAEAMSGFTRDEVLGKHFVEELLDIEGQDLMAEQISHAWSGQTVQQIYLPFYTKCGRRKDLCLSARLSWSKAEDIHHVTLIGGLIAGDACKTISVDEKGCITGWGEEVQASLGFSEQEVLGLSFPDDIVTYGLRDLIAQKLDKALAGDDVPGFILFIYSSSGMKKWFLVRVDQRNIDGSREGATFILTQLDEREGLGEGATYKCEQPETTDTLSTCAPSMNSGGKHLRTQDSLPSYWAPSMDLGDF